MLEKISHLDPALKAFLSRVSAKQGDITGGNETDFIWVQRKGKAILGGACLFHRAWESGILKESRWGVKWVAGKKDKDMGRIILQLPPLFRKTGVASVAVRATMGSHAFVQMLEKIGFHYVGGLVTLRMPHASLKESGPASRSGVSVRPAGKKDLFPLKKIAREAFREGRFYHEPGLKRGAAQKIYGTWAENMLNYADEVKVAGWAKPLGFVSLKKDVSNKRLWIDLIAVAPGFQSRGIGGVLAAEGRKAALRQRGWTLGVKTEPENLGALRFYLRNGFELELFQLDYIWRSKAS